VVGYLDHGDATEAFVWQDGVLTLLPTLDRVPPGYVQSEAFDINESGQIVGRCSDGRKPRAVLWDAGQVIDITPPTTDAFYAALATGINIHGVIVGVTQEEGQRFNGLFFVIDHGATVYLDPAPSEFVSVTAYGINDSGEIAASAEMAVPLPDSGRIAQSWQASAWSRTCFAACCE